MCHVAKLWLHVQSVLKQLCGSEEASMAQCAEAEVTTRWLGFHRIRHGTGEIFDSVDLFLPDMQFPTQASGSTSCVCQGVRVGHVSPSASRTRWFDWECK